MKSVCFYMIRTYLPKYGAVILFVFTEIEFSLLSNNNNLQILKFCHFHNIKFNNNLLTRNLDSMELRTFMDHPDKGRGFIDQS